MIVSLVLTWVLLIGLGGVGLLLLRAAWKRPPQTEPLPESLKGTNVGLRLALGVFVVICVAVAGFHTYWALIAPGSNPQYSTLKDARDQRLRRQTEASLRGWVFDRSRLPEKALCRYKLVGGRVYREYPLGSSAAHLLGYTSFVRGDSGIERAFEKKLTEPAKLINSLLSTAPVGSDLMLSLDADLQRTAGDLLKGARGAVVVIRPQTGEILALASSPGFDPTDVNNEAAWQKLIADTDGQPFLNRALNNYYLPGSTFKTIVAAAALESGLERQRFTCTGGGYTPPASGRPIKDDKNEVHGSVDLAKAFEVSCNQYFAQMGVELGYGRLGDVARRFGFHIDDSPESARQSRTVDRLWNSDGSELDKSFGVVESRMVLSPRVTAYDIGLQSIGQGFDQATVLQMALVAAAVARSDGMRLAPALEAERQVKLLGPALNPSAAKALQPLMRSVVERGTASRAFRGCRIPAAGKTGTAQVAVRGGRDIRIDAWFIGFAPYDNPKIAFAVVVEGGGYGGEKAAPIARALIEQADRSGLFNLQ
ncbi:MAG TPA: penicillin-binding transpeptidase domain-containing protein [Acidobacteriota bacterium]|nr:penicillin-binding transpeptidase domain-containing protein [Acidobacteriota bacterium]HNB73713.1 penicillin-binding transpeptidase domain-containing protein [Acidobacteriota bacterium]HND21850.1 penicillin-binding transpeptidase domain-containing protein [Acidobacteriota bacterium]